MNTDQLIQYIIDHGHSATGADGKLIVACNYASDGKLGTETETIPATLSAVKAWLGY